MGRLDGKRALITGGTTGIGQAIAERFLHEGAAVTVTGRDPRLGKRAEGVLRRAGDACFLRADAADPVRCPGRWRRPWTTWARWTCWPATPGSACGRGCWTRRWPTSTG